MKSTSEAVQAVSNEQMTGLFLDLDGFIVDMATDAKTHFAMSECAKLKCDDPKNASSATNTKCAVCEG